MDKLEINSKLTQIPVFYVQVSAAWSCVSASLRHTAVQDANGSPYVAEAADGSRGMCLLFIEVEDAKEHLNALKGEDLKVYAAHNAPIPDCDCGLAGSNHNG
jgi:hypothetical protein